MSRALSSADERLKEAAKRSPDGSLLVAFSGGKDSLAVLDLATRCGYFKRIECFFMYFIEGMRSCEEQLQYARDRWGVTIHQVPHWNLVKCLKAGIYCFPHDKLPEWKLQSVYQSIMGETGIPLIATGAKKSDSLWRRRFMHSQRHETWVVAPCAEWSKFDVLSYLRVQKIRIPDSSGANATGVDLSTPSVLWLHDNHPDDFAKLRRAFPFVDAVVMRRDIYGIE